MSMKVKIPLEISSSDQLGELTWELEQKIAEVRRLAIQNTVLGREKDVVSFDLSPSLQSVLDTNNVTCDTASLEALEGLLGTLKALRDTAPEVHLTLAAFPTLAIRRQLVEWLRKEIHPQVFCSFSVRSDLCGGLIIRTGAVQYDFSFRSRLINNKHRISEIYSDAK